MKIKYLKISLVTLFSFAVVLTLLPITSQEIQHDKLPHHAEVDGDTTSPAEPNVAHHSTPNTVNGQNEPKGVANHAPALHISGIDAINSQHTHPENQEIDSEILKKLIDKHLTPAMRSEINETLRPKGEPPQLIVSGPSPVLDTSDRAGTVMIAIIDDEQGLVVTDFTQPLPLESNEPTAAVRATAHD